VKWWTKSSGGACYVDAVVHMAQTQGIMHKARETFKALEENMSPKELAEAINDSFNMKKYRVFMVVL